MGLFVWHRHRFLILVVPRQCGQLRAKVSTSWCLVCALRAHTADPEAAVYIWISGLLRKSNIPIQTAKEYNIHVLVSHFLHKLRAKEGLTSFAATLFLSAFSETETRRVTAPQSWRHKALQTAVAHVTSSEIKIRFC